MQEFEALMRPSIKIIMEEQAEESKEESALKGLDLKQHYILKNRKMAQAEGLEPPTR